MSKVINNRVICECGKDLGEFEEGKVYFCKNCIIAIGFINTYTNISLEDVFEDNLKEKKEDSFKLFNYIDGTEIGAKIEDLQKKAIALWSRLFDKKEDITSMKEEIGNFLLEVYMCRKWIN
ncbi:MAG: hypothetical protein ACFFDH_13785 [Promethearchaeota archaeon]